MGLSLKEKVTKAIATLQHYEAEALKFSTDGYYLCDSFGKDSCVILDLAKRAGVKFIAHHNLTTIDPPELIWFGKKYHSATIIHKPEHSLFYRAAEIESVLPTRLERWCCKHYKENAGGWNKEIKLMGIRAQESGRRKALWKIWTPRLS